MLRGIDHDPGMSAPDGQITGLRICHSPEFVSPCVEIRRGRVLIRETGAHIEGVDQVRAVGSMMARMQCGTNNRQALMPSQGPGRSRLVRALLCQRGRGDQQAEQQE